MRQLHPVRLNKIRIIASLLFFIPISIIFIDPRNIFPTLVVNIFVSFQLIPSLAKIFVYFGLTTAGLLFVILLTFAFGRVYCSTICPLGTLQDIIIHIRRKIHPRNRFSYRKYAAAFHYSVFALIALTVITGSLTLLNLLEPFSNYGRILTNTVEPVFTLINNGIAAVWGSLNIYSIYSIPLRQIIPSVLSGSVFFLFLIGYMSYKHGRLFCNSVCPTGAILGLISRVAIFKIVINKHACNECGACEKVCKASCIDAGTKQVDFAACVGCFNCVRYCPTDGIGYERAKYQIQSGNEYNPSRRKFFAEIAVPAIVMTVPSVVIGDSKSDDNGYSENRKHPISPPGSKSIEHFSDLCTACHLCVVACPAQVLYPSFLEYGATGIFQPKMNYDTSFCTYDCIVCSLVCPSGAILPLDVESKKLIQIGKAIFVKDDCVVVVKKKDCAACSEHCPTKAVHMVPYDAKLKIPELNNDVCVGCGACEHACPTTPQKAIYVASNPTHLQAQKPKIQKQDGSFDSNQGFPF